MSTCPHCARHCPRCGAIFNNCVIVMGVYDRDGGSGSAGDSAAMGLMVLVTMMATAMMILTVMVVAMVMVSDGDGAFDAHVPVGLAQADLLRVEIN